MKNIISKNYGINNITLKEINKNIFYFYINYQKFYFIKTLRSGIEIDEIKAILTGIINEYHIIIPTLSNKNYLDYMGDKYILLKIVTNENNENTLADIIRNQVIIKVKNLNLIRFNWGELWSKKIDYLEYQISELSLDYTIIKKTFSYFIGMAENAIQYYNSINITEIDLVLSHKRIISPNTNLNYYNPLSIVIDYRVRDIAEYIKSCFFNGIDCSNEVENLIIKGNLNSLEYNLLYIRLLFPNYYFDDLELVLEKGKKEDRLIYYAERIPFYEEYLSKIKNLINKKSKLLDISWIH